MHSLTSHALPPTVRGADGHYTVTQFFLFETTNIFCDFIAEFRAFRPIFTIRDI